MKTCRFGLALALLCLLALPARSERLLIVDDDLGMLKSMVRKDGTYPMPWIKVTDPDGGLELVYALRAPGVRVLGVTCSMGCSTTDVCMASAQKILELTGHPEIPLLRGADSPADLGRPTAAARFIVDTVMSHPGQVEIVATAPLTNLATALMLEPCLAQNWKTLHFATGEFMNALGDASDAYRFRFTGYRDLNINVDPKAAAYVLERGGVFPIYPNEVMDDAWIGRADQRAFRAAGTPLSLFLADEINPFLGLSLTVGRLAGYRGLYLHGVIPLAVALEPELAEAPAMRRVTMAKRRVGGYYFAFTDDPAVPPRPVYARLADRERLTAELIQRCR